MAELSRLHALAPAPASPQGPSDAEVVEGLLRAEAWAANELYTRLHQVIDRTLRRVLQSARADWEDLNQTVFERVVRTLVERRFSGDCSLTTWAGAIASNVAVDAIRGRVRDRSIFTMHAEQTDPPEESPCHKSPLLERQLEARAELSRLHDILGRMHEKRAKIVLLHDMLGYELSEISQIMGVSVAAAQSNLVRGRRELLRRARASIRGVK